MSLKMLKGRDGDVFIAITIIIAFAFLFPFSLINFLSFALLIFPFSFVSSSCPHSLQYTWTTKPARGFHDAGNILFNFPFCVLFRCWRWTLIMGKMGQCCTVWVQKTHSTPSTAARERSAPVEWPWTGKAHSAGMQYSWGPLSSPLLTVSIVCVSERISIYNRAPKTSGSKLK